MQEEGLLRFDKGLFVHVEHPFHRLTLEENVEHRRDVLHLHGHLVLRAEGVEACRHAVALRDHVIVDLGMVVHVLDGGCPCGHAQGIARECAAGEHSFFYLEAQQ